jgi:hypothetical protein
MKTARWTLALLVCLGLAGSTLAATRTWNISGAGSWHDANNWDPNSWPTQYDTVYVKQGEAQITSADAACLYLSVDSTTTTTGHVLLENNKHLHLDGGAVYVGEYGAGTFNQYSGMVNGNGSVILGRYSGSTGYYGLSGGSLTGYGGLVVGKEGQGTFHQSGGAVVSNLINVGTPPRGMVTTK